MDFLHQHSVISLKKWYIPRPKLRHAIIYLMWENFHRISDNSRSKFETIRISIVKNDYQKSENCNLNSNNWYFVRISFWFWFPQLSRILFSLFEYYACNSGLISLISISHELVTLIVRVVDHAIPTSSSVYKRIHQSYPQ